MTSRTRSGRNRTRKAGALRRSLARFRSRFPRLLRTDFWASSRSRGLWTSIFGERKATKSRSTEAATPKRKARSAVKGAPRADRPPRRYRKPSDLRLELLEPRQLLAADVFVNDNWHLLTDVGVVGSLDAGDIVRNDNDIVGAGTTTATIGIDAFGTITTGTTTGPLPSAATIQDAITAVNIGGTVHILDGTFIEDVNISKSIDLIGAGPAATTISGAIGGSGSTVAITASTVEVAGLKITREGNNTTDWNNPNLNGPGISIQGLAITGASIHDNLITGNRTGIDINNSNGHTVRNNRITDNRTGLILRNQTDNLSVTENEITNNWTVGIVFLDASTGSNVPVQQALGSTFTNNNISGNWYGQIVDRQTGGSLPVAGANPKNFSGNWFGTAAPVITTADSTEPGYAAQIPFAFGGSAVAPGGQPDIAGPASANFDITPILGTGTDTNVETTPGRGTFGLEGYFRYVYV
jgi:parallel beta-helix repeat protein